MMVDVTPGKGENSSADFNLQEYVLIKRVDANVDESPGLYFATWKLRR